MNINIIIDNCEVIKKEIERTVNPVNITDVQDKLNNLASLTGLSAETLKDCKGLVLYKQKEVINIEGNKLNPSILKLKIEGELWNELSVLTYCERLNAALTHCMDGLRTIISLYKTEMSNNLK